MKNKLTTCPVCGAEMASSAKACPSCGAKPKKPIYKKWWAWVLLVVVIAVIGGSVGSSKGGDSGSQNAPAQDTPSQEITYTHYNVTELFDALQNNALKAQDTFKGQYVEIEGYLYVIDSDGKYFSVSAGSNNFNYILQNVQCFLKDDQQRQQIMEMSVDSPITVRGKITQVGEVLGYSLSVDSID